MLTPLLLGGARLDQLLDPRDRAESVLEVGKLLKRRLGGRCGQDYYLYIPRSAGKRPPLMVSIHGISRNARQHAKLLSSVAELYGVIVLAPLFSEKQFPDYQRLGRLRRGPRADLALDRIVGEVLYLTGADTERLYLFGYSGGGQFAHRYAMAHPERVAGVVIGAAGWYTMPQSKNAFPYGVGLCQDLPSLRFDSSRFLRVPMTVIVGARDTDRDPGLNKSERIDRLQGRTRVERAITWVKTMNLVAKNRGMAEHFSVEVLPGVDHSFELGVSHGALQDRIFAHLFSNPREPKTRPASL
jgi:poly(3-hydroxybutyrate) depolymerase